MKSKVAHLPCHGCKRKGRNSPTCADTCQAYRAAEPKYLEAVMPETCKLLRTLTDDEKEQRAALDRRLAGRAPRPVDYDDMGIPNLGETLPDRKEKAK